MATYSYDHFNHSREIYRTCDRWCSWCFPFQHKENDFCFERIDELDVLTWNVRHSRVEKGEGIVLL